MAVTAAPGPDLEAVAEAEGVKVYPVPMARRASPAADLQSLLGMGRVIREFRPDLVSAGTPKAGLLGMLAARVNRTPARVYVLRGLRLETLRGARRWVLSRTERIAAGCAGAVVCVSESLRRRAVELGLVPEDKAVVLAGGSSNGVDVERFQVRSPGTPVASALRERLGLRESAPVIGFVGRLSRDKGIEDLIRSLEQVVWKHFADARLVLVGGFDAEDPVPSGVRNRLHTDPRFVLTGPVDETAPYYGVMDLLAFPSYREGFPNAPLEAAASGIPVAGYAATGTVDAIQSGVTGTLVPTGEAVPLGQAICSYLADPELRRRHGEAGRERVVREFRSELVWAAWERFYRRAIQSRGKR